MSPRELERVEVMGRIAKGGLKLLDAAIILELSYRQVKNCGDVIRRWAGRG